MGFAQDVVTIAMDAQEITIHVIYVLQDTFWLKQINHVYNVQIIVIIAVDSNVKSALKDGI